MDKLVIANWKMNPQTQKEAKKLFNSIEQGIGDVKNIEVVVCPPAFFILNLKSQILNLKLGAQDCFWRQSGPYTGEISPQMLKEAGCEYVILGHSERRKNLGETNKMIEKKLKASLEAGLIPILCIGETQEQRQQNKTQKILESQLKVLNDLMTQSLNHLVLACEPVWAISSTNGMAAQPEDAKKAKALIQEILNKKLGLKTAEKIKILYGGSVDGKNVRNFVYEAEMDGVLVGQASLNAQEFIKIIQEVDKI